MRRVSLPCLLACLVLAVLPGGAAAAQPAAAEYRLTHPNGTALLVQRIEPRSDSILLFGVIANPTDREISLNRSRSLVLSDAAGAVHRLHPPADNPELRIAPRSNLAAELVFVGPPAPTARELRLSANEGIGTADNPYDDAPMFRASLALPGSSGGDRIAGQADHPNGVSLRVRQVLSAPAACFVALLATNGGERPVRLNEGNGLVLLDARGTAAPLRPPAENPALAVPPGARLDAELVFDCSGIDGGGLLSLVTNRGTAGTPDNPYDPLPVTALRLRPERVADGASLAGASRARSGAVARSRLSPLAPRIDAAEEPAPAASPPKPAEASRAAPEAAPTGPAPPPPAQDEPNPPKPPPRPPPGPPPSAAVKPRDSAAIARLETALAAKTSERGTRIVLSADVLFGMAGDTLQAPAEAMLDRVAALIAARAPREVVVAGHTDGAGPDDDNLALSQRRAHAVAAWLESRKPPDPPRYIERGYGRTRPAAPNHHPDGSPNPEGRERNRRIEIMLRR